MDGEMEWGNGDAFLLVGASIPAEGLPWERRFVEQPRDDFFCDKRLIRKVVLMNREMNLYCSHSISNISCINAAQRHGFIFRVAVEWLAMVT